MGFVNLISCFFASIVAINMLEYWNSDDIVNNVPNPETRYQFCHVSDERHTFLVANPPAVACKVSVSLTHDDIIIWKYFPRYWPFAKGIHRSPVNSPNKGQWRGALMLSLICARTNGWENNREAGNLRRHRANYDVTVMAVVPFVIMDYFHCKAWHEIINLVPKLQRCC